MKKLYTLLLLVCCIGVYAQQELAYTENPAVPESSDIKVYPNPAYGDVVYISSLENKTKHITVYDVFGEVVLQDRISSSHFNIASLIAGVYVLQITESNKTVTRKLVVK